MSNFCLIPITGKSLVLTSARVVVSRLQKSDANVVDVRDELRAADNFTTESNRCFVDIQFNGDVPRFERSVAQETKAALGNISCISGPWNIVGVMHVKLSCVTQSVVLALFVVGRLVLREQRKQRCQYQIHFQLLLFRLWS